MKFVGIIAFACVYLNVIVYAGPIPEYIHICKRNDPEVGKCVRASIEVLRPHLKTGIPELGVPSLEPFHIEKIDIIRGQNNNNFRAGITNLDVYGASNFQIRKLKVDVPQRTISAGVKIPVLTLIADYDVDARILVVPVKGKGKVHANATTISGKAVGKYEIEERSDGRYIKFTVLNVKLDVGDYNVHLENLFSGDPTLGQAVNTVLNENKEELIKQAMPFLEERVSEILLNTANKIVKNFKYDDVFPEK